MTTILLPDGSTSETPLTPDQLDWLRDQAKLGWIRCSINVIYGKKPVGVNVLDVKQAHDTVPSPAPSLTPSEEK